MKSFFLIILTSLAQINLNYSAKLVFTLNINLNSGEKSLKVCEFTILRAAVQFFTVPIPPFNLSVVLWALH